MADDDRSKRDHGFTLTELLITIVLVSILAGVIAATFSIIVRTAPSTEARTDDSRTLLSLSRWLPVDVMSTMPTVTLPDAPEPVSGFDTSNSTPACSGISNAGVGLLGLTWTEGSTVFRSYYRYVSVGDGRNAIKRMTCTNGGPVTELTVSAPLQDINGSAPVRVELVGDGAGGHIGVAFEVDVIDPTTGLRRELLSIDARTRNIAETMPALPSEPVAPPPTNQPPVAGDVSTDAHAGIPVQFALPVTDDSTLQSLGFSIDSEPDDWLTSIVVDDDTQTVVMNITPASDAQVGDVEEIVYRVVDGFGLFDTGTVTVTIIDPGIVVVPPDDPVEPDPNQCVVSSVSINPNPVANQNQNQTNIDVNRLVDDVDVTITTSGDCAPLVLTFVPNPEDSMVEQVEEFKTALTLTIKKNSYSWRDGSRPLRVREGVSGPVLAEGTLVVT